MWGSVLVLYAPRNLSRIRVQFLILLVSGYR